MTLDVRFDHVNLSAEDRRARAGFTPRVFGREPVPRGAAAPRESAKR